MDVKLVLFKKDGSRKIFPLPSSVTVVGRRHDCDLRIPLLPVSKRHCELSLNKDTLKVRDLGSRNGTYINGKQIGDEVTIGAGDYLTIGPLTFLLQIDGQPKEIVPPTQTGQLKKPEKPAQQKKTPVKPAAEEDSFVDLDIDESDKSDSFLDELKNL